jgi:ATP-dependent RNA helicase DDX46/PRP5
MSRRRSRFAAAPLPPESTPAAALTPTSTGLPAGKVAVAEAHGTSEPAAFRFAPVRRGRGPAKRMRTVVDADTLVRAGFAAAKDGDTGSGDSDAERKEPGGVDRQAFDERGISAAPALKRRRANIRTNGLESTGAVDDGSAPKEEVLLDDEKQKEDARYVDPLDEYMREITARASSDVAQPAAKVDGGVRASDGLDDADDGLDYRGGADGQADGDASGYLHRNNRKRPLYEKVDHSRVEYAPFQKELYHEVPELSRMTPAQVKAARRALGSVRIRGKRCPKPICSFGQCGLSSAVLDVIRKSGYEVPTPIQAQAIPCIMSGRDVIGVAKTGSGKTLAFLLPILRHVALQERPTAGEGPIAILVAPTRELAIQIYGEAKRFARATDLRCVCAYGGSGVKDQISDLKRGADIVVCTPGRMIDLLAMNSGRITNLRRVTIVVLDEADRMFDMGFEPQLTRLVENVRPDRQTVMFSATFPPQVERLARTILTQPVEIVIGGNSIAANTVDQHIEVRAEESKFRRLLQLLGVWYDRGSSLVFVDRQDNADRIFRDLSEAGYLCLSLHGGMDQADRDSALADFKNGHVKVLVATSVAARGLDVKHLTLVVNYDVPNHYEDYVHRVGRTGRAGRAGTAYTFITEEQGMFAGDMVKALEMSARSVIAKDDLSKEDARMALNSAARDAVPSELRELAASFAKKQEENRRAGVVVHGANSGYGGRGFTFDEHEGSAKDEMRKSQAKRFIKEAGEDGAGSDSDDEGAGDDDIKVIQRSKLANPTAPSFESAVEAQTVAAIKPSDLPAMIAAAEENARHEALRDKLDEAATAARLVLAKTNVLVAVRSQAARAQPIPQVAIQPMTSELGGVALSAAAAAAAALSARLSGGDAGAISAGQSVSEILGTAGTAVANGDFEAELEINDYPQHARWRVTHANALEDVTENTGCVATTRGNFYPVGRNPPAGERKLHLLIEGPDERSVKAAYKEIKRKLEEAAAARPDDRGLSYSKYSVV